MLATLLGQTYIYPWFAITLSAGHGERLSPSFGAMKLCERPVTGHMAPGLLVCNGGCDSGRDSDVMVNSENLIVI
jgi:hypothetical protein